MSQETVVPPVKDDVSTYSAVQPAVEKQAPVTVNAETAEPKKQVATKAAVQKVAPKSSVAKKVVAEKPVKQAATVKPAKKEAAEKAAPTPKTPAKPTKKVAAEAKAKVAEAPKAEKVAKAKKHAPKKPKMVRDSFTIPENDYALFETLKQRALAAGVDVKKSELLRASLMLLAKLDDAKLVTAIGLVERIKTGRPKK